MYRHFARRSISLPVVTPTSAMAPALFSCPFLLRLFPGSPPSRRSSRSPAGPDPSRTAHGPQGMAIAVGEGS